METKKENSFISRIPISTPELGEEEVQAASEVIRSGWIAQGVQVAAFETSFSETVNASYTIALSSGTAALHLALNILEIGPEHEVLLPSLSFIATANAVLYTGAKPIFVDVLPNTFNLDPAQLRQAITPRTRAILPVHQLGLPADLENITAIAREFDLYIIEDAACALGAMYHQRPIGSSDNLVCFSFHPRKIITTGEGGAITTQNQSQAEMLRQLRSHGVSISAEKRHIATSLPQEHYHSLGYNYRMTDIQAAIGRVQLKRLPGMLVRRRTLAKRYYESLRPIEELSCPLEPEDTIHAYQSFMVLAENLHARERLLQELLHQGIAARRSPCAIHKEPLYQKRFGPLTLPVTEDLAGRGLLLPLDSCLTDEAQDMVIQQLKTLLSKRI